MVEFRIKWTLCQNGSETDRTSKRKQLNELLKDKLQAPLDFVDLFLCFTIESLWSNYNINIDKIKK